MREDTDRKLLIYLGIAGLQLVLFLLDRLTPRGITEWIFHILPIGLCLLQRHAVVPLIVAFSASVLILIGYLTSPPGGDPTMGAINRTMGVTALWCVAFIVRQTLFIRARIERLAWLNTGQAHIAKSTLGDKSVEQTGAELIAAAADYLRAQVAVLYRLEDHRVLRTASHALGSVSGAPESFKLGEGVVGQAARDGRQIVLMELPADYLKVTSATGAGAPQTVVIAPIKFHETVCGVIELGFLRKLENEAEVLELLAAIAEDVGVALRSTLHRQRVLELLDETQRQSEELQSQQEELRVANEELTEQGTALRESQARLENQQAELEETNAQLAAQTADLERQKRELLDAQSAMKTAVLQLERASAYKSEFLANMSHELRTPLNSSLILSKVLADNAGGNLTEEQVNYAKVIQASNNDLLALINDILDLSKIEAGHVKIERERIALADVLDPLRSAFEPVAQEKNLKFRVDVRAHVPDTLDTDPRRLQQVLRNLLSNALKFTHEGSVELRVTAPAAGKIRFAVEDTGIGIPEEQREAIFDEFHQGDGTTSRKYGGTGLGLSISRELARLLGGVIDVQSTVGVGSVFALTIPVSLDAGITHENPVGASVPTSIPAKPRAMAKTARRARSQPPAHISDDRAQRSHSRLILLVEDDPHFAQIIYGLSHELDLDCVHTTTGSEAIALARELNPSGIILDVGLPDDSGLSVLERLKRDPATRHIPVHMLSVDDYTQSALQMGAIGYTLKSAAREQLVEVITRLKWRGDARVQKILIVEDDEALREGIAVLLGAPDVEITLAGTVAQALEQLATQPFDCMVMDLALPDASGFELLARMSKDAKYASPRVIVYTGRALTPQEEQRLRAYSGSIIIKGARSPERLLDEVALFLHRVESTLPPDQQKLLRQARSRDAAFEGRVILVAEDDVRNIYALSSVLEPLGAKLEIARNGREALERVASGTHIDLVLMDVMMPDMDGLTAMREIRKLPAAARLPMIAITAKAMPEDRRACLDAGANDYVSKPIDVDKLLSLCRVWMPK